MKDLLLLPWNLLCHVAMGVWTLGSALWLRFAFLRSEAAGHEAHRRWARGLCRLLDLRVVVEGADHWPRDRAVVVAPNHASMWDIVVLASLPFDFKWISKKEVARIPFFGPAMRNMGCYFVSRDRSGKDLGVLKQVERGLAAGKSVVIFPEGTRTRTGELLPFKKGAFRTAQNAGVPLLPVGIVGAGDIAPPGVLASRRGCTVTVRIGEPFPVPPAADLASAMEAYRTRLVKLLA